MSSEQPDLVVVREAMSLPAIAVDVAETIKLRNRILWGKVVFGSAVFASLMTGGTAAPVAAAILGILFVGDAARESYMEKKLLAEPDGKRKYVQYLRYRGRWVSEKIQDQKV